MADKIIMNALWRDGYHAAARLIEALESSISKDAELMYLKAFAQENCFEEEICRVQFRALWTAYCLHHSLTVDTSVYDSGLLDLWNVVAGTEQNTVNWSSFNNFSSFMCRYLV